MYTLDYNIAVESLNVPDKRTAKITAFNKGLVAQTANLHNLLFEIYKGYSLSDNWTSIFFARGAFVKYGKSIFQAAVDTTNEPTMSNDWILITSNFLGSDVRLSITGNKLPLEIALNIWFGGVFRYPTAVNEIYVSTNVILSTPIFRVGATELESSNVYSDVSSEFVINAYSFTTQNNLTIYFPTALYNGIATTSDARNSIIRNFADKYINAGLTYNIATY